MIEITLIEKSFDFEGFTKAILSSLKHFGTDFSEDESTDLLLGINSEGDILYLDKISIKKEAEGSDYRIISQATSSEDTATLE